MFKSTLTKLFLLTAFLLSANNAAQALALGTYELHNHPDGGAADPLYGLRLDRLYGSGIWTFDFDHADSAMFMTYSNTELRIFGSSYGGRDGGTSYDAGTTGVWEIDFTYDIGWMTSGTPTAQDIAGADANHVNFGSIERDNGDAWDLRDHAKSGGVIDGWSFLLTENHRGFNGVSGWGWLDTNMQNDNDANWYGSEQGCCNDWLFTVGAEVPEPSSLALLALGLLGLGSLRKK